MTADRLFFGAFTVERRFGARPERVFRAFADREMKQRWMGCEEVAAPVIERLDSMSRAGRRITLPLNTLVFRISSKKS